MRFAKANLTFLLSLIFFVQCATRTDAEPGYGWLDPLALLLLNSSSSGARYLVVTSKSTNSLYRFDLNATTGAFNNATTRSTFSSPDAIDVSPDAQYAFVEGQDSKMISMFSIDSGNGTLTQVAASSAAQESAGAIKVSPDSQCVISASGASAS